MQRHFRRDPSLWLPAFPPQRVQVKATCPSVVWGRVTPELAIVPLETMEKPMPMKCHELSDALKITDATKDKIVKAKLPGASTGDAEEYVVETCEGNVLTLHKAPATHT